jgi:hypothetical protein
MKTQNHNPAYRRFKGFLPSNGRYPANEAQAHWNRDKAGRVKDVEVVYWPQNRLPAVGADKDFYAECTTYTNQWEMSAPVVETPESVFGWLVVDGFADNGQLKRALEEFAHIDECEWARKIVKGFQHK